jgi:hypothetical protein
VIAVALACFFAGLFFAIPLGFWISRGFRFTWRMPAWRFDPESLEDEMSSWATLECEREW